MNYMVTTTFSHPSEMDKTFMKEYQKNLGDNPYIENIWWFEIDAKTHGSIVSYKDKASYEADLPRLQEKRDETKVSGIHMTLEAKGECFAILRD